MYKNINSGEVLTDKEYLDMIKREAKQEFKDFKQDYLDEGIMSAEQLYEKWLSEPDNDFKYVDKDYE